MYVTAHRVKSRRGAVGINAFLHEHTDAEWAKLSWNPPSILSVAEGAVGHTVDRRCDLPPGGNHVLSYLDVAASESTKAAEIDEALDALRRRIESDFESPLIGSYRGVGYRFGAIMGLWGQALAEFDELRGRLVDLFQTGKLSKKAADEPLKVLVTFASDGYRFRLAPESENRVRNAHGTTPWTPATLHVPPDEMMDFEAAQGDIYPHVVTTLTGLRIEALLELGGAVFISAAKHSEIRRWPKKG